MTDRRTFLGGVNDPQTTTPGRPPTSIRRTMHTDMAPMADNGKQLAGACRDLITGADGGVRSEVAASLEATVDQARHLLTLQCSPSGPSGVSGLTDRSALGGFRAALDAVMPEAEQQATPLYALLDELPVAALISGYADLYSDAPRMMGGGGGGMLKSDICSGWRGDGLMMRSLRETGSMPVPLGPAAPALETQNDPIGWHAIGSLSVGAMRRRRRLDVWRGEDGHILVDAMFRDSHVESYGQESVVHEYHLAASVDPATMTFVSCVATPRVLPWDECPAAAASAGRVVGVPVSDVRMLVRQEFRGTSICTHLNDLVRFLGFVEPLLEKLDGAG